MDAYKQQKLVGLYGSRINRENAVGYCYYHRCHLTIATLKCHECLRKQCNSLKKHEEHAYWAERENRKLQKIANKNVGGDAR